MKGPSVSLFLLLLFACRPGQITAAQWKSMSEREKTLTVESMQGHERALQRKGGEGHPHTLTPAKYVARIDRAYRAGSGEPVNAVWETLADRQPRR